MGDMNEKKTLGAMEAADVPASLSSDLDLEGPYEHACGLDQVSEYTNTYKEYKEKQVDNSEEENEDEVGIMIPEDFKDEANKIEYVVQAIVGQILVES
ncbi:hypothetical protein NW768_009947 [Fusarium equiseti]|uniref:Uncharacterized protein n=1 Tax=Fusarium equiseti TaxID=61235 RepID=A0ABQ8R1H5_FUSEQ|nr:hypothetical protein NW768_009947 [Fusarium equiseti]